ncbi:MAG: RIP metalloprotease RseP [Rhodospirillales bacterium]|nr:RIP metalloprotease RseP [Rhodospirillales bacterium]
MDILSYIVDWIVPFVVVFTILVFVHELGHYWIARRAGVRIETFAIGFGPELFGRRDSHGTRWKVCAIPLGGYVKMFGEQDFESNDADMPMTAEDQAVSFHHKRLGQRAAIVAAGPLANFAFAIVLLTALFTAVGLPFPLASVGQIQSGSAAAEAGFVQGDRILRVNDEDVASFEDLRSIVRDNPDRALRFEIERGGDTLLLTATPQAVAADAAGSDSGATGKVGLLGVSPDPAQIGYQRLNPFEAVATASQRTWDLTTQILGALGQIITGSRTAEELGGPLRIAQLSGQMAQGGMVSLVFFMAALSINLGLINLFPVPMLDGGHLAFYAVEAVRGRPLNQKIQEYGFRFGLVLVLLLMIFATWNDLVQLQVVEFFKKLVT